MPKLLWLLLFTACTSLFYHPDRVLYVKPENYKFVYREVVFPSRDETELVGWFFPSQTSEAPKGTIVHFHGNAQNMSSHFLGLSWVMDKGYNLFVFDYRGYGISDGSPDPEGVYLDSLAALDQGRELWESSGKGKFIVYGQSLGGAVSMRALKDYKHLNEVSLVVQDSTFMSYQDVAFHKLSHSLLLPFSPLAYLLISDKFETGEIVESLERPTLVIVGQKDPVIDQKFGKEIFKTLPQGRKWLWKIPKGQHIDVFHDPKAPYRKLFLDLLDSLKVEGN